jgi:hypothetical protein
VSRNWKLDKNAVDRWIIVQTGNLFDEFGFGDRIRVMEEFAVDACL